MIRIVADEKIPFLKGIFDNIARVDYMPGNHIGKEEVKKADGLIIRTRTRCNSVLLDGSNVKFIATATIGHDHIDAEYCRSRNINWANAPGCNSASVEQYVVSALLEMYANHGVKLKGQTIGIIGVGNVGSRIARVSRLLGLNVLLNDPPRKRKEGGEGFVSLETIQKEADIISFHTPLNRGGDDNTFHLADESFFDKLGNKILLINSSRGEVVKGDALKDALRTGKVSHAVLDVWENEPEIDRELLEMASLASCHIAGYSTDGKAKGTRMAAGAIADFFGIDPGESLNFKVPGPDQNKIVIDCTGMNEYEILYELYGKIYDIAEDDKLLRDSPSLFENLRGSYRLRREAPYYSLRLNNNPYSEIPGILEGLGFQVLETDCFC